MLDLRRRAQDAIAELESNPRGELVIAANEATCIYVLPKVFSQYPRPVSGGAIAGDRSYGARVVEAVMDNSADFGLTQLPVEEKRMQVVHVHRDEIRLIVPAGHPLRGKRLGDPHGPHGIITWCCPQQGKTRTRLNAWLEPVEDDIQISMELDSTEMMKRFVMAGLGLSFLAASNCREEIAAGKLRAIPLAPEPMVRRLGLIYRKDKALSKAALGFIQVVLDNVGDEAGEIEKTPVSQSRRTMTCHRCRKNIDKDATRCPYCGEPNPDAWELYQTSTVLISAGGAARSIARWKTSRTSCEAAC